MINCEVKIIKKTHNYKLSDFMKTTANKDIKVFDMVKIHKELPDYAIKLFCSPRGKNGKNTSAKTLIGELIKKYPDFKFSWVYNTIQQLKREKMKFGNEASKQINPWLNNYEFIGDYKTNNLELINKRNKKVLGLFYGLSTIEGIKGSREPVDLFVWDEINVFDNRVGAELDFLFDSLLQSATDQVKQFGKKDKRQAYLFFNGKRLDHKILEIFKIFGIHSDLDLYSAVLYINGKKITETPFLAVFAPQYTDEDIVREITKEFKNDWKMIFSLVSGVAKSTYFNKILRDEANGIIRNANILEYDYKFTVNCDNKDYYVYEKYHKILKCYIYYLTSNILWKPKKQVLLVVHKADTANGYMYDERLAKLIRWNVEQNTLFYENITVKKTLYKSLGFTNIIKAF